jgi:hypothetical protein
MQAVFLFLGPRSSSLASNPRLTIIQRAIKIVRLAGLILVKIICLVNERVGYISIHLSLPGYLLRSLRKDIQEYGYSPDSAPNVSRMWCAF